MKGRFLKPFGVAWWKSNLIQFIENLYSAIIDLLVVLIGEFHFLYQNQINKKGIISLIPLLQ